MTDVPALPYDFGDDADDTCPGDAAFDAWLMAQAPALNAPGATPAEPMWSVITAAQATARDASRGRIAGVTPLRRRGWLMPAVIAAALLIGVALDRLVVSRIPEAALAPVVRETAGRTRAGDAPAAVDQRARADLYRLAAVQTLSQAEALLTAYRASGVATRDPRAARQLGGWAREVLGSTRLLIDSPAGEDPQLRPMLSDLELVLVQIVRLSGTPLDSTDRALIDRALRDRDLLPRIRTVVPAGAADATAASED